MATTQEHIAGIQRAIAGFYSKHENEEAPRPNKAPPKKRNQPTEHEEQCALVKHLRAAGISCFAVPNEMGRDNQMYRIAWLKAQGMVSGAPDLVLITLADNGKPTAIEVKSLIGKLSDKQVIVKNKMESSGWNYVLAIGYNDGINKLKALYSTLK